MIFEKNNGGLTVVNGIIRDVQDDGQILHLEDAVRTVAIPGSVPLVFPTFPDLYISICDITEFSPILTPTTATKIDAKYKRKKVK